MFENCTKNSPFHHWRQRVCGLGAAVAGTEPYQHVWGRGTLLSADRKAAAAFLLLAGPGVSRSGDHYGSGIRYRPAGEPGLPGLGLPGPRGKCEGADLSALHGVVDPGIGAGHGAVWSGRSEFECFSGNK